MSWRPCPVSSVSWGQVSRGLEIQAISLLPPYWHVLRLPWSGARSSCFVPSAPSSREVKSETLYFWSSSCQHALVSFSFFFCCWTLSKASLIINYLIVSVVVFFPGLSVILTSLSVLTFPPFSRETTLRVALLQHLGPESRPCQFYYLRQASANSLSDPVAWQPCEVSLCCSHLLNQQRFERNVTPAVDTFWCVRRGTWACKRWWLGLITLNSWESHVNKSALTNGEMLDGPFPNPVQLISKWPVMWNTVLGTTSLNHSAFEGTDDGWGWGVTGSPQLHKGLGLLYKPSLLG